MIENAVFNTAMAVLSAAFLSVIPEPDISLCFKHFAKRYTEPVTSLLRRVFMYRVLLVEDDRQIREFIGDYFGRRDHITPGTGIAIAGRIIEQHGLRLKTKLEGGAFEAKLTKK